jgi:4-carboxymuconolactone decarboxylase
MLPQDWSYILKILITISIFAAAASFGQSLPADIDATTLTRLPPVQRQDLDADGQKIFDSLAGPTKAPMRGILGLGIYDPKLAEALHLLHDSVTKYGTLGNRVDELAILVATREEKMSLNEWYSHEAAALKAGIDQSTIDVVKFGKEPTGLDAKDALIIRFGREWFRDHHVSSDTFAKTVEAFGQRGTVELIGVMGDYAMVGMMLQAVDQQLPNRPALPPLKTK